MLNRAQNIPQTVSMNPSLRRLSGLLLTASILLNSVQAELDDPYGVLIGTPSSWGLEDWSEDLGIGGSWPHYLVELSTASGTLQAAIDLSTTGESNQVRWRELDLEESDFPEITSLGDGWQELPSHTDSGASTGGALDYLRHPTLLARLNHQPWRNADDTEPLVEETNPTSSTHRYDVPRWDALFAAGVRKAYILGEAYSGLNGVHNVHQNQGDPEGEHSDSNGIWQDGAMILEFNAPRMVSARPIEGTSRNPFLPLPGLLGNLLRGPGSIGASPLPMGPIRPTVRRILIMTRFQVQSDYTDSLGGGYFVDSGSRYPGESARAGLMKFYGPFASTSEVQVELANATGRPTVYVRYGSRPSLSLYESALHSKRNGTLFQRLYNTSGADLYIGIRSSDPATYDLSVNFHP